MKYTVHVYVVAYIPYINVEATSMLEAKELVESLIETDGVDMGNAVFADEVQDYLVDSMDESGRIIDTTEFEGQ